MKELYELKDKLCRELKSLGHEQKISATSLQTIDTLAHAIKNIDKVIEGEEQYSNAGGYGGSYGGMSHRGAGSYAGGNSYADGYYNPDGTYSTTEPAYSSRGRSRDSMGRYSSAGYSRNGIVDEMRELMQNAPDEHTRQQIQRLMSKMESM